MKWGSPLTTGMSRWVLTHCPSGGFYFRLSHKSSSFVQHIMLRYFIALKPRTACRASVRREVRDAHVDKWTYASNQLLRGHVLSSWDCLVIHLRIYNGLLCNSNKAPFQSTLSEQLPVNVPTKDWCFEVLMLWTTLQNIYCIIKLCKAWRNVLNVRWEYQDKMHYFTLDIP